MPSTVPAALSVFVVFALGMLMLGIAIWEFNSGEQQGRGSPLLQ
jgi:hypothetical protein